MNSGVENLLFVCHQKYIEGLTVSSQSICYE